MEHFRSSGTSGGLLHSRTESSYLKKAASEFLRAVGIADAEAIATGAVSSASLDRLTERAHEAVSESWLEGHAADEPVVRFRELSPAQPPEELDRAISNLIRRRFPVETERPAVNSRWG